MHGIVIPGTAETGEAPEDGDGFLGMGDVEAEMERGQLGHDGETSFLICVN